jgi:pimeloyl-ACP methyl ester carboxylesterase
LHGWPQHWFVWRGVLPLLAGEYRCVMPDLRGLGWSSAPTHGYEKQTLANDVLAVLDALGIERAGFIGHDWGGWIAFLIALEAPRRVRSLLALNIVPPWPPRVIQQPRPADALGLLRLAYQPLLATPWLGELLLRRTGLIAWMLRADNVHREAFSAGDVEQFAAPLREAARAHASSLYYRDWLTSEFVPFVRGRYSPAQLEVPALLLYGTRDAALGPEPPQAVGRLSVEAVHDSGHFIAEERPDLVAARARALFGAATDAG